MNSPDKDQKLKHAIKDINNSDSIADILAYVAIDNRPDVVDAAKLRCAELDSDFAFPEEPMKQGQVETITRASAAPVPAPQPDVKMITKEAAKSSVITIRDGKAVTVHFDEKGKEIV
jgi:hypothetical protein